MGGGHGDGRAGQVIRGARVRGGLNARRQLVLGHGRDGAWFPTSRPLQSERRRHTVNVSYGVEFGNYSDRC